ncbi:hypothetical protein RND71_030187 [Anisodus tanguticus]|uniref:Uncharacterized protein n=1 Tax=Anisodus tanguticus TaxID=243964 RepID=A0AAE1V732_9SOLA|nr:hypothetical protein RND71_030187 [Anisodus tanguticus]
MESPLLSNLSSDHRQLIGPDGDYRFFRSMNMKELWAVLWIETVKLWEIGGPITFNIICQYGLYAITVAFCGHLGAVELSAVSVAQTVIGTLSFGFMWIIMRWITMTIWILAELEAWIRVRLAFVQCICLKKLLIKCIGMGSALETLCGQAFGAGQVHMLGVYTQRSMIILLLSVAIGGGWQGLVAYINLGSYYAFGIPLGYLLGYVANFGVMGLWGGMIAGLTLQTLLLSIVLYRIDWNKEVCWANAIAQFVYVVVWCKDGWTGWSLSALNDIWAFVRLSVASAVMLCLEIWYMMSIIILTGHLKDAVIAVGSLSICMNVDGWEAMLFIGINAAIR